VAFVSPLRSSSLLAAIAATLIATPASAASARTEAALLIEADTGKVLFAENATMPWYPASITKLMTAYVTLQAVKSQRITLDTPFTVSPRAATQAPSKIGLKPGSKITVDNALKILMVKSANDVAVVLAEGVSGSVEQFAAEMTETSRKLGMTQSNWVNPNGLPADEQLSSARDLAMLGRALLLNFPEYDMYWRIPAIQLGKKYMRNYNTLIGRYDGADGMKTGFICASGFNLVASATRGNKRLIAVVLGSPSSPYRAAKAAGLLERGFSRSPLTWLSPALGSVESLQPVNAAPPDLRDEMCGPHRKRPAAEEADDENEPGSFLLSGLPPSGSKPSSLLKDRPEGMKAIAVFIGAAKSTAEAQFAIARDKVAKIKGKKPGDAPAPAAAATPAAPASTLQTVSAPPAGAFTPTQTQRPTRSLPTANDSSGTSPMSFAPASKTDPAPLTAMPDAKPAAIAKKPAATANKPAATASKPAATASKPAATANKPVAAAQPTPATNKPAAAKTAAPGQPKTAGKPTDKKAEKKSDDKKDPKTATKKPAKSAATGTAPGATTAKQ
jgi:D-alanyl-D-alanine carboxypeptidase